MTGPMAGGSSRDVAIRDESIRLGQLLKLADLVDAGSDARLLLADDRVFVNGELETRRGRQVRPGDVVEVVDAGPDARVRVLRR